ncbi:hypothetical protein [Rossellomorea marisflavi]|uniref:hypothetical protein n=1 Tax=Rossellomorea marisflavi TaxID=189381 RepID=UPI00345D882E
MWRVKMMEEIHSKELTDVTLDQVEYYNCMNELGEEYVEVTVDVNGSSVEISQFGHIENEQELNEFLEDNGYKLKHP